MKLRTWEVHSVYLCGEMFQSLCHLWTLIWLFPVCPCPCCTGRPWKSLLTQNILWFYRVDTVLQVRLHQCIVAVKQQLPQPRNNILPNAAQEATDLLCQKDLLLALVQFVCLKTSSSPSFQVTFQLDFPQLTLVYRVPLPRWRQY